MKYDVSLLEFKLESFVKLSGWFQSFITVSYHKTIFSQKHLKTLQLFYYEIGLRIVFKFSFSLAILFSTKRERERDRERERERDEESEKDR